MRKTLALGTLALSVIGMGATAANADACTVSTTCAATTVATTVGAGTLAIVAVPVAGGGLGFTNVLPTSGSSQTLDSAADLTLTTVTDTRLTSTGWSVTANMTDLTGVPGGSIAKGNVKLSVPSGGITKVLGAAGMTITGSPLTAVSGSTGDLAGLVTAAGAGGINTVTYTPHVDITVPTGTAAGVYTGILTQSVA